jgi:Spy/CpxP family protein refolding chaperone
MAGSFSRICSRYWKTGLAAAIALGAVFTLTERASARPGGGMCGGHRSMLERLERDVASLGLAQDQLASVYQVIDEARTKRRGFDGEIRAAHERMHDLLEQDAPSVDAVTAQADSIGALHTEARKVELRAVVQVRGMLSEEQREQLDARAERFAGKKKRGGPEL